MLDLARGVVRPGEGPVSWAPLAADHPYLVAAPAAGPAREAGSPADGQQDATAWLEAERAEAHRLELERSEQARVEAGRREAAEAEARRAAEERAAADRAQAEEARRVEAERRTAAEEAERLDRKRRREERLEAHRLEVEQREAERAEAERAEAGRAGVEHDVQPQETAAGAAESAETEPEELQRLQAELDELELVEALVPALPETEEPEPEPEPEQDELDRAVQSWLEARSRGDRRQVRAANEQVVELLRPRAEADPASFGPRLREALESLASLRLRSGDVWGSRSASREAKTLGRRLHP